MAFCYVPRLLRSTLSCVDVKVTSQNRAALRGPRALQNSIAAKANIQKPKAGLPTPSAVPRRRRLDRWIACSRRLKQAGRPGFFAKVAGILRTHLLGNVESGEAASLDSRL